MVVAQLQDADPAAPAHAQRLRLSLLGRDRARADLPCSRLSGGQRLKPALACALYRAQPAQLLLLDEPTHHLDLASVEAIEALLRGHQGALVVASHPTVVGPAAAPGHGTGAMAAGAVVKRAAGDPGAGLVMPAAMADHLRPVHRGRGIAHPGAGPLSCFHARRRGQRLYRYLPT